MERKGRWPAIRLENRTLYQNAVLKQWANRRGQTAGLVPIQPRIRAHYRHLFRILDSNDNGQVDADDFMAAAQQCQIDLSRDQVKVFFIFFKVF